MSWVFVCSPGFLNVLFGSSIFEFFALLVWSFYDVCFVHASLIACFIVLIFLFGFGVIFSNVPSICFSQ